MNPTLGAKKLAKLLLVNHKRVARVLKERNLNVQRKKRVRTRTEVERIPAPINVTQSNELWSVDFMCTRKTNAFRFMILNVVDVGTRVSPLMKIERSFTSMDVTDELEAVMRAKGRPKGIVTDNGAEFTSSHFTIWCRRNEIIHHLTNKGAPAENCFVESFNSCVRREVLDQNDFRSMNELRQKIEKWRRYYNEVRPHGSLNFESPENYIKLAENQKLAV